MQLMRSRPRSPAPVVGRRPHGPRRRARSRAGRRARRDRDDRPPAGDARRSERTPARSPGALRAAAASLATAGGLRLDGAQVPQIGLVSVRAQPGTSLRSLARTLRRRAGVAHVEVERRFQLRVMPNDPSLTAPETSPGTPRRHAGAVVDRPPRPARRLGHHPRRRREGRRHRHRGRLRAPRPLGQDRPVGRQRRDRQPRPARRSTRTATARTSPRSPAARATTASASSASASTAGC